MSDRFAIDKSLDVLMLVPDSSDLLKVANNEGEHCA